MSPMRLTLFIDPTAPTDTDEDGNEFYRWRFMDSSNGVVCEASSPWVLLSELTRSLHRADEHGLTHAPPHA